MSWQRTNSNFKLYVSSVHISKLFAAGQFVFEVHSVSNPSVSLRSYDKINVAPPPMRQSELGDVFDDLDKMLQFL